MNLLRKIRDFRYAKGWSVKELASRAEISRSALYQIERGSTTKPQTETLRGISRALGVPVEVLLATMPVPKEGVPTIPAHLVGETAAPSPASPPHLSSNRADELIEKFRLVLTSPLGDGVGRILEEAFRQLRMDAPPKTDEPTRYTSLIEIEPARNGGGRSSGPA